MSATTRVLLAIALVIMTSANALADDPSTTENVTRLKDGILETLATWIPFVILFVLIGLALAAIGIDWGGLMRKHGGGGRY